MKNKFALTASAIAIITAATTAGLPKLTKLEGDAYVSYKDVVGVWTGCAGVTTGMKQGLIFTKEQCDKINSKEFNAYVTHVYTETGIANIPLLTVHGLFTYNIGKGGYSKSQVLTEYRAGHLEQSCQAMMNWNGLTVNGVKYDCNKPQYQKSINGCKGIVNRRTEEVRMCMEAIKLPQPEPCGFWCSVQQVFGE